MSEGTPLVRALYDSVSIPGYQAPYNAASLKLYYPALLGNTDEERNSGAVPADASQAPFPVVILCPGINVSPEAYSWLAQALAASGIATLTYSFIAEAMPGQVALTPGLDLDALTPEGYGLKPSATAIEALVGKLAQLNRANGGLLRGMLDLNAIILGGHSAGGSVALFNAKAEWFAGISASFSYATHAGASTLLGWPPATILPLPSEVPTLLLGGNEDGVIAASSGRYAVDNGNSTSAIETTFDESISSSRNDSYLFLLEGANHFSLAYPEDTTTGRAFLESPSSKPGQESRDILANIITQFILGHVKNNADALSQLQQLTQNTQQRFTRAACK
ncbi:MAG: hypothetical protein V7711_08985 [Pseudomonadales bacterium]